MDHRVDEYPVQRRYLPI